MDGYQKTPQGIMQVLRLFHEHYLSYILFKCEHIFAGQNKNLDILFETDEEYRKAGELLEQRGFVVRLSESIEKYKTMYCGFIDLDGKNPRHTSSDLMHESLDLMPKSRDKTFHSIHLHREIAWHGMKALDKKPLFKNAQQINSLIIIPSLENSILIHSAHILFENFKITEKEKIYLDQINNIGLNHNYIKQQIKENHWEKGFKLIIKNKEKEYPLNKSKIIASWANKLMLEPKTALYFSKKSIKRVLRPLTFKRKGNLIAFIGANGSGKSTLTRKILEHYQQLTAHLGIQQSYYYFGWKPTFSLTSIISKHFKKKDKKLFQELNFQQKIKRFDLKQELLFLYQCFEYYYRYRKEILPLLKKNQLVVCDRYFYDIYGQYPYAKNSIIINHLLKIFPKPNFTYVLDLEEKKLQARDKTDKNNATISSSERKVMSLEYLQQQRKNFHFIALFLKLKTIITERDIDLCSREIINETWKKLL